MTGGASKGPIVAGAVGEHEREKLTTLSVQEAGEKAQRTQPTIFSP